MRILMVGLLLLGLLAGCSDREINLVSAPGSSTEETTENEDSETPESDNTSTGNSDACVTLSEGVTLLPLQQTDPTRSWRGTACLNVPESMTSLSLYGFGESSLVALENFFPQSQPEATAALQEFIWFDSNLGDFSSLGTQVHPEFTWDAGAWEVSTINVTTLKAVLRTTPKSASPTVRLAPFLASSQFQTTDLATSLQVAQGIFQAAGVQVILEPTVVPDPFYTSVGDFDTAKTSEMVRQGGADAVNLFFVDDLDGYGLSGLLGKAAGIPGSIGVQSAFNGVLISLSGHEVNQHLDDSLLAETVAHESGHLLGLFHTSESGGTLFDPLSDTPECPDSQDLDQNQQMSAEECAGLDGTNLMFWTPFSESSRNSGLQQHTLSPLQIEVLARAPITK